MLIPYGEDPAYVGRGPVIGFGLSDSNGNPKNHDENYAPGIDAIRLVSLRSLDRRRARTSRTPIRSRSRESDFVWLQHIRVMNRACEIAFDGLTNSSRSG